MPAVTLRSRRTAYESNWRAFEGWCDGAGRRCLALVTRPCAAFPAAQADQRLRPALCRPIRHFHYLAGVDPAPTDVAIVKSTMKGLRH
jgi:hypothetical protein